MGVASFTIPPFCPPVTTGWEAPKIIQPFYKHLHVLIQIISIANHKASTHYTLPQIYEVWLWSSRNDFIAPIPVHLQLIDRGHLRSTPLSSYALSPRILLLLETFLEFLLWNDFQCRRHIFWTSSVSWNLRPFKADFIFGNSQKSFGAKSG
jgi:hypothetical protein